MRDSDIRPCQVEVYFEPFSARTPLKFGAVVMTEVEFCRVKVTVENRRGEVAEGWGGIFLSDVWAWPTPELDHQTKTQAMETVARRYARAVEDWPDYSHPVEIFMALESELERINEQVCRELGTPLQPFLGALVSASPTDGALHDAFGNVNGIDSYLGYGPDFMSDLSPWLGEAYRGKYIEDYLRPAYLPQVPVFHLVGGLDKLTRAEKTADDPDDGEPVSLDEYVEADGVFCLKVKLRGNDLDWDLERTLAVHDIAREGLLRQGREELHLTADTNEICDSPQYMIDLLHRLRERSPQCYDRVLYVEQPTSRDLYGTRHDMRELARLKPVLLDESLVNLETLELGLETGWSGIALKTCKGHSMELIMASKAREEGIAFALQDLTNPSLALIHAVGMGARLYTMQGLEANARQFFPFSSPPAEVAVHEGCFRRRRGMLSTDSLRGPGLGLRMDEIRAREG